MPFEADTPTPRICRKFTREGGAVSARHTQGSAPPSRAHLGPAAGHTDQPGDFARAKWRSVPPAGLIHGKAEKRRPPGEKTGFFSGPYAHV